MTDGGSFASGYDGSEIEAELATWDSIKGDWDDVELRRVEEQTFVPLREACSKLIEEAADVKSQVAMMENELKEIKSM